MNKKGEVRDCGELDFGIYTQKNGWIKRVLGYA